MKRFEFPLDRLLTVKRQLERVAEQDQLRARRAVEEARSAVAALHADLGRVANHLAGTVGRAVPPNQWAAAAVEGDRLGRAIAAAEAAVRAAEDELAAAAKKRTELATEVEALATHRRQRWDDWRRDVQKADQDALDELGLRRWQAAHAEAGPPDAR